MKTVYQTSDVGEMTIIKSVLESSGIDCMLLDEYTQIIRPSTLEYSGGGRLAVADEKEEEAKAIIDDYLKTVNTGKTDSALEAEPVVNAEAKNKCPECGSTEFEPAFWSIFFGGNKFKCKYCGTTFKIENKTTR